MKRLMKTFVLVAAAAMALTSCENEVMDSVQENDTYTLTFVADAPESTRTSVSVDDDAKTASFAWSENGEYLKFLQYTEEKTTLYQQMSNEGVVATDGSAKFEVTFGNKIGEATEYYYSAIYPECNVVDKGSVNAVEAKVPAEQTLTINSYDPNADLMVAKPVGPVAHNSNAIYSLEFHRLAAVGRMNIMGIKDNEKIYKVVFTLAEGTKFAGKALVNLDGNGTDVAFLGEDSGDANAITLTSTSDYVADNAGTFVYFTCLPLTYTGSYTLEVETDAATYINTGKSISNPISFTAGNVTGFNISAGTRTDKSESNAAWVKVNNLTELTEGTKIALVGTTNSGSYSMKTDGTNDAPEVVSVSFDENGNLAESSINAISTFVVGVDSSNYILYGDDTKADWLYCTSSNNGVRFGTNTNKTFAIAAHTNSGSNWQIKHVGTGRFVGIYNDEDWRCYTTVNATNFTKDTGTSDIAIYRYSEDGTSTPALKDRNLAFSSDAVVVTLGEEFTAPTLNGVTDGVTYSSSEETVATVDADGNVEIKGVGTTTITATAAANDEYKAGKASYNIKVVSSTVAGTGEGTAEDPYDVTRAIAKIDEANGTTVTGVYVKGEITADKISFNSTYKSLTYKITDGTNTLEVYSGKGLDNTNFTSEGDLHAGDVVVVYGNLKLYNTTYEFDYNNYIVSRECTHTDLAQTVSFISAPASVTVGSTVTVTATAYTTVTYTSNNTSIAIVDATTGVVTGIAEGTVTITATAAAGNGYASATATHEITVKAAETGGGTVYFEKLTSAPSDWSGTYLIVYEGGNVAFNGGLTTLDAVSNTVSVTISDSKIEATDAMKNAAFTINANGHIKSASGYYVGQTSNANGLKSSTTTTYTNTLSVNSDGSVNAVSGGAYLRYNATSGQTRFRYFKSGTYTNQKAIHFYKLAE